MPSRRSRRTARKNTADSPPDRGIQGAPLEPIRVVERMLTGPDGTRVRVKVPVYPPFRLADRTNAKPEPRKRVEPRKKKAS